MQSTVNVSNLPEVHDNGKVKKLSERELSAKWTP
jgi:hypothetical protein